LKGTIVILILILFNKYTVHLITEPAQFRTVFMYRDTRGIHKIGTLDRILQRIGHSGTDLQKLVLSVLNIRPHKVDQRIVFMRGVKCDAQYIQKQRKVCILARTVTQHCNYAVGVDRQGHTKEVVILLLELLIGIPTTPPTKLCHTRLPLLRC
jgi:hypothetical protein